MGNSFGVENDPIMVLKCYWLRCKFLHKKHYEKYKKKICLSKKTCKYSFRSDMLLETPQYQYYLYRNTLKVDIKETSVYTYIFFG